MKAERKELDALIKRTHDFDDAICDALNVSEVPLAGRASVAYALAGIAMDHGYGIRSLMTIENDVSAMALFRLQFEAVLRSFWVTYAATDEWVVSLTTPVSEPTQIEPARFPNKVDVMLSDLEAHAEPTIASVMRTLKDDAWDAMNSYTHGGLRQIIRFLHGHDLEALCATLRNSNGLTYLAALLTAESIGREDIKLVIAGIRGRFSDCLHPIA